MYAQTNIKMTNDWTSDSINSNKNANNVSYEDYMSECIVKNITYIREPTSTHLNDNMKNQLALSVEKIGKLVTVILKMVDQVLLSNIQVLIF